MPYKTVVLTAPFSIQKIKEKTTEIDNPFSSEKSHLRVYNIESFRVIKNACSEYTKELKEQYPTLTHTIFAHRAIKGWSVGSANEVHAIKFITNLNIEKGKSYTSIEMYGPRKIVDAVLEKTMGSVAEPTPQETAEDIVAI